MKLAFIWASFTLFILVDQLIHIDTVSMELYIFYSKGLPFKISITHIFVPEVFFIKSSIK